MADLEPEKSGDDGDRPNSRSQHFFDPWLICDHPRIESLVDKAVHRGEVIIAAQRLRKRRDRDRLTFRWLACALVANAAYALARAFDPPTVAIALAKPSRAKSRYDGPGFGQRGAVLAALSPDILILRKSRRKGIASAIEAAQDLADDIARLDDFGVHSFRREGGETIVVHRVDRDFATDSRTTTRIEYVDDAQTKRFRAELQRINFALASARLDYERADGPPMETRKRQLRRIFNTPDDHPRFDLGGRVYGGWWQNIEREHRPKIRIDGERVADLDFSAMFLRLAYVRAGLQPRCTGTTRYRSELLRRT